LHWQLQFAVTGQLQLLLLFLFVIPEGDLLSSLQLHFAFASALVVILSDAMNPCISPLPLPLPVFPTSHP